MNLKKVCIRVCFSLLSLVPLSTFRFIFNSFPISSFMATFWNFFVYSLLCFSLIFVLFCFHLVAITRLSYQFCLYVCVCVLYAPMLEFVNCLSHKFVFILTFSVPLLFTFLGVDVSSSSSSVMAHVQVLSSSFVRK